MARGGGWGEQVQIAHTLRAQRPGFTCWLNMHSPAPSWAKSHLSGPLPPCVKLARTPLILPTLTRGSSRKALCVVPGVSRGSAGVTVPPFRSPLKHLERESTAKRPTVGRRQRPQSHLDLSSDLKAQKCVCATCTACRRQERHQLPGHSPLSIVPVGSVQQNGCLSTQLRALPGEAVTKHCCHLGEIEG